MIKRIDASQGWVIIDTERSSTNPVSKLLFPDIPSIEGNQADYLDMLSNWFKLRSTAENNSNTAQFIYAAFAELPFK